MSSAAVTIFVMIVRGNEMDIKDKIIQIEKLIDEHPYRISGRHDTFDPFNQGWCDAIDRVLQILEDEDDI